MNKPVTNKPLTIVADANMPQVDMLFSRFGDVHLRDGRTITRDDLVTADVLLVRSVTQVNESLLEGTSVKFVGSATAGLDHISSAILNHPTIQFANAVGANARSVVEYDLAVLAYLYRRFGFDPFDKIFGIIGYGNVGRKLTSQLLSLGLQVKIFDPLVSIDVPYQVDNLSDLLACDVICIHAPLTHDGKHATNNMLSSRFLGGLKHGAVVVSAGRGGIVDETALIPLLKDKKLIYCADVWCGEPLINQALKALTTIATPHIAGYSSDSKLAATEMLLDAMKQALALPDEDNSAIPPVELAPIRILDRDPQSALMAAISAVFPIEEDDAKLRHLTKDQTFDGLRANYWQRREFRRYTIEVCAEASGLLKATGFNVTLLP